MMPAQWELALNVLSHCSLSSSAPTDFVRLAFFPSNLLQASLTAFLFDLKCSLHVRGIDEPAPSCLYVQTSGVQSNTFHGGHQLYVDSLQLCNKGIGLLGSNICKAKALRRR